MNDINRISEHHGVARFAAEQTLLAEVLKGVRFAVLYGSVVSGTLREDSDVDLAVMYPTPLDVDNLIYLAGEVSAVFRRDADLLDLHRAGPIIKMQVLQHGCPVIINDPRAYEEFRMHTPGEYFDFKLSRRAVEEAVRAWGAA